MKLRKKKSSFKPLQIGLALVILSVGTYFVYGILDSSQTAVAPEDSNTATSDHKPEDRKKSFPKLSERPVRIAIDKIGVDASIQPVGLTPDGLMDAPNSNDLVGWYEKSSKVGESKYSVLLDGHYGTSNRPAVFWRLAELKNGDEIKLTGEAGAELTYKVVEIEQLRVEEVDMRKAMYPYKNGSQSLTIITCDGHYDAANNAYDRRTIVYAERKLK